MLLQGTAPPELAGGAACRFGACPRDGTAGPRCDRWIAYDPADEDRAAARPAVCTTRVYVPHHVSKLSRDRTSSYGGETNPLRFEKVGHWAGHLDLSRPHNKHPIRQSSSDDLLSAGAKLMIPVRP